MLTIINNSNDELKSDKKNFIAKLYKPTISYSVTSDSGCNIAMITFTGVNFDKECCSLTIEQFAEFYSFVITCRKELFQTREIDL